MSKPTHKQIKAVHEALYKHQRLQKQSDLLHNLGVIMNMNPAADLPTNDVRYPPGSGPQWFFPDTGQLDNNVLAAAQICDQIDGTILEMESDVKAVDFPAGDKQNLTNALSEEAASWSARAKFLRTPTPPAGGQAPSEINDHLDAALTLPFARTSAAQADDPTACRKGCLRVFHEQAPSFVGKCCSKGLLNAYFWLGYGPTLGLGFFSAPVAGYKSGVAMDRCLGNSLAQWKLDNYDCVQPGCPGFDPKMKGGPCEFCGAQCCADQSVDEGSSCCLQCSQKGGCCFSVSGSR